MQRQASSGKATVGPIASKSPLPLMHARQGQWRPQVCSADHCKPVKDVPLGGTVRYRLILLVLRSSNTSGTACRLWHGRASPAAPSVRFPARSTSGRSTGPWKKKSGAVTCCIVSFMDDFIILKLAKCSKAIHTAHCVLADLKITLHPVKLFIGKTEQGFDFLGYQIQYRAQASTFANLPQTLPRTCPPVL